MLAVTYYVTLLWKLQRVYFLWELNTGFSFVYSIQQKAKEGITSISLERSLQMTS